MFHLFGALAQFEREIIRDRTIAGLSAARARGRVGGRPSKPSAEQRAMARRLYDERQHTVEQIGQLLGVSRTSIYRALATDAAPEGPGKAPGCAATAGNVAGGAVGRRAEEQARLPERQASCGCWSSRAVSDVEGVADTLREVPQPGAGGRTHAGRTLPV